MPSFYGLRDDSIYKAMTFTEELNFYPMLADMLEINRGTLGQNVKNTTKILEVSKFNHRDISGSYIKSSVIDQGEKCMQQEI